MRSNDDGRPMKRKICKFHWEKALLKIISISDQNFAHFINTCLNLHKLNYFPIFSHGFLVYFENLSFYFFLLNGSHCLCVYICEYERIESFENLPCWLCGNVTTTFHKRPEATEMLNWMSVATFSRWAVPMPTRHKSFAHTHTTSLAHHTLIICVYIYTL